MKGLSNTPSNSEDEGIVRVAHPVIVRMKGLSSTPRNSEDEGTE